MIRHRIWSAALPLILLSGLSLNVASAQDNGLGRKSVFSKESPRCFSFRGENNKTGNASYENWCAALDGTSGFIRKFIPEEVPISVQTPGWANVYADAHPEKLAMLHLNGEARQVCDFAEVRERYFPGHWVYMPGTVLTEDCSASDTLLKVKNARPLKQKGYAVRKNNKSTFLPQMVILVRLDEEGNRLWYESEFAEIRHVDVENGTVSLQRGVYGTEPVDFRGGRAYIAPIAGGLWGKHVMFYYNLSSVCPKDRNGQQAKDVYADEIASWFQPDGVLSHFDGIAFDVNYFDVSGRGAKWDVDNDGKADGGWIGGQNVWREGDIDFFVSLRRKIGDSYLISADGQHWDNQQLPSVLNGIESEGLVQHNDMWRGFSRTMNTHTYWMNHQSSPYDFRYVVMKLMGKDVHNAMAARTFGAACAACLGASITIPVGEDKGKCQGFEFLPDAFSEEGSMGKPVGDLVRYYESAQPQTVASEPFVLEQDKDRRYKDGEVPELTFTLENVCIPAGDVVFTVQAEVLEYDSAITEEYQVPALMWMRPEKLPQYDKSKLYDSYFTELYGLFGPDKGDEMTFYFRNMEEGVQSLQFRIRGASKVKISGIKVYPAPDVVMRRFEHAVVVANPSLEPVTLRLSDFFGGKCMKKVTVAPTDAVYVKM